MDRYILTDAQWAKMAPHCLGKATDRGRSGRNNRLFLEAVLWIARTEAAHGEICPRNLVNGILSLNDIGTG